MQVVHPICAGIDVHKAFVTVSLRRVADNSVVSMDNREFATTTPALLELLDWLVAESCPVVAMESTGVYWRPVYQVLSNALDVIVGNAYDMRRRPGKKTDRLDAEWISELLAHGLIAPSFVPPPAIA
ncbi:MAG: transposase, partial [Candidatus Schekmanbacteria bacterium]|nr:transposase [Candidatus Schekmanbacteria bacterium]